jgi:hypothetical protein
MWLKEAAPELLEGLAKVEKAGRGGRRTVEERAGGVRGGGGGAAAAVARGRRQDPRFKPHAAAFLGYLVSHESHHRGQIAMTLKQAGHPLDRKTAFGLWEWGVR